MHNETNFERRQRINKRFKEINQRLERRFEELKADQEAHADASKLDEVVHEMLEVDPTSTILASELKVEIDPWVGDRFPDGAPYEAIDKALLRVYPSSWVKRVSRRNAVHYRGLKFA